METLDKELVLSASFLLDAQCTPCSPTDTTGVALKDGNAEQALTAQKKKEMTVKKGDLIAITAFPSKLDDPNGMYYARLVGPHPGRVGTVGEISKTLFDPVIAE